MQFYCSLGSMPSVIPSLLSKPFNFWNYSPDIIEVNGTCKTITCEKVSANKKNFVSYFRIRMILLELNSYIELQMEELKVGSSTQKYLVEYILIT